MNLSTSSPVHIATYHGNDMEIKSLREMECLFDVRDKQEYRARLVDIIISLKSKPLLILAGKKQTGKVELLEHLAGFLTRSDEGISQAMVGHPWWADHSEQVSTFVHAQTRMNSDRLLFLFEEAIQHEKSGQTYMACLKRISPAELLSFFTEVSEQITAGRITHLGDAYLSIPVRFPTNLILAATMDSDQAETWDPALLANTTIIEWPVKAGELSFSSLPANRRFSTGERLIQNPIRSGQEACKKFYDLFKQPRSPFQNGPLKPLFLLETLLTQSGLSLQ